MLDILEWILEIAGFDARRMSPVGLVFAVLVFGGLGLLLTILPLARFIAAPSWAGLPVVLLALALGLGMLARISWGLFARWRGQASDRTPE